MFSKILRVAPADTPYIVFFFCGSTLWNFFANSLNSAVTSLVGNASLLAKVKFDREILPTAAVLARGVDYLLSLLVLFLLMAVYGAKFHTTLLLLPVVMIPVVLFTLGLSYLFASLNILYRDVNQLIGLLLLLWFYVTPIIFPASVIPQEFQYVATLNPMAVFVTMYRGVVLDGVGFSLGTFSASIAWGLGAFLAGRAVFKRLEPSFAEIL